MLPCQPPSSAASRSASAMSSTVLALKKGSSGVDRPGHGRERIARGPAVDLADVLLRPARGAARRATPRSTARSPDGSVRRMRRPRARHSRRRAPASSRATRSRGRNGQSAAALSTRFTSGRLAAIQSSAARMPASGPGKSATSSAITGRPKAAKRAGSPLALRISPSHCGASRAITRSRMVLPPMVRIGLSPPPMRRASPPASSTPGMPARRLACSVVTALALALVPRRLLPRRNRGSGRRRCAPRPTAR